MATKTWMFALCALAALGCRNKDETLDSELGSPTDEDGDGYDVETDCDDTDPAVNPEAEELCDGVDNDCDGDVDGGAADASEWFADADGDGYGDPGIGQLACEAPDGYVADSTDCDDANVETYPGAAERCEELDNDCDAIVDEDVLSVWYADADGDLYGDAASVAETCDPPDGYVADATDCDDTQGAINPAAEELCDGVDNDCDTVVDEPDASDAATWYQDSDGDGYGDVDFSTAACEQPTGYVADSDDCDDTAAAVNPGATEVCNSIDDDCDGTVDNGDAADAATWYADSDGDSYGDGGVSTTACAQPSGYVSDDTDCDDSDASVNTAGTELCDGVDNDCDGSTDEDDAADAATWYADDDGDSYGDASDADQACAQPSGYVSDATDCDDGDSAVNPGETEVCNGIDDDCDGTADEDDAADAATWYADTDGDSYGDASNTDVACDQPSGYLSDDTDCDDSDATVYPGADELRDGQDNDCDGSADNDLSGGTGNDGTLTVSSGTTDLSTDASGGRSEADAISYLVTAISGASVTVDGSAAGYDVGDEVLLVNLQGSDTYNAAVGTYEFGTVVGVSSSTVTLAQSVVNTYGESSNSDLTDQVIVLQRVPNYDTVTVSSGAVLTTSAWGGTGGGVLAFRAAGGLTVDSGGLITVDALGFAGGDTGTLGYNCDAYQGESYAGLGSGEYNGTCSAYNEATGEWAPNYGGGGAHICGGGGNFAGGATGADSWTGGSATPAEAGLSYGDADLSTLFFGSGGGGVWNGTYNCTGSPPGPGGDGAGILYIGASSITTGGGDAITAIGGSSDACAQGSYTYGAGGGAGGTIWLAADTVSLASGSVSAEGGYGNSSNIRHGGDGGYGRVRIDCNTCNTYSQGSANASTALNSAAEPDPGYSTTPE
ncbi:MAG: putative metal-binding motif-containing protein [Alphaproteobacteria bacterium]|nr:putative metal-binding motif-containing protein [Alphaproteobacteria bacterium]MCB9794456.1 putative metal-binding motif-containing protein [Alphaproteobacteria bacterium]